MEHVEIPFFREEGFFRKKCKVCGSYFWTLDDQTETCMDAPCAEYTFIGSSPVRRRMELREVRETFLRFFEKRGHTRIRPYPVVARWRDDLYFTIASIVDFQPYVTSGEMPPPANPLVVSQPCLRFEDIDRVGPTAGRHLTIFEMGGHHAFNSETEYVYWADETVRLHHELLTKVFGVPEELVAYKEGFWSGGGNAGPDLESAVCGLEVSTLVFMQYRVVDGSLQPNPLRIVDTGYGMERWCWLTTGDPTAFHSVYGDMVNKLYSWSGTPKPDESLLKDYFRMSGTYVEKLPSHEAVREISEKIGADYGELLKTVSFLEAVCASLDHTKALAFLLAEGVVPSNVREGYLARLLLRRCYRFLRRIGLEDRLLDVLDLQFKTWSRDFPHLADMREEALEMASHEVEKYLETLRRGAKLVGRLVEKVKKRGLKSIPVEDLVELYDSHGLTLEDVAEAASKHGVSVEAPREFYSIVAERHTAPRKVAEKPLPDVSGIPATELLYYEDPYMREFRARVLKVLEGGYVALDRTAFYPEGGGQPHDTGFLEHGDRKVRVTKVIKVGNVVLHRVEGTSPEEGTEVRGVLDWDRRYALMRSHTATHILLGAARRVLGKHVWQAGAQKGVVESRLDVSHHKRLTREEVERIERLANQTVWAGVPVETVWMRRDEAEARYGFRLYQGGAVPGAEIRVVRIGGWDVEACGGTHCRNTSEVGLIKIVKTERIQDGVERLVFSVGPKALEHVHSVERLVLEASERLRTPVEELVKAVEKTLSETKSLRKEVERLRLEVARLRAREMFSNAEEIRRIKYAKGFLGERSDVEEAVLVSSEVLKLAEVEGVPGTVSTVFARVGETVRVVVMADRGAVEAGIDAGRLASEVAKVLGGGGGGSKEFGQGGGPRVDKLEKAFKLAGELIRKQLGG